jgi:hypothetical protein
MFTGPAVVLIELLAMAFIMVALSLNVGPNSDKPARAVVLLLMIVPLAIFTWLLWRGRKGHPAWMWRVAMALDAVAVAMLIGAAVITVQRAH